jgi:hypothetical protein
MSNEPEPTTTPESEETTTTSSETETTSEPEMTPFEVDAYLTWLFQK